jgi:hypothetical protein
MIAKQVTAMTYKRKNFGEQGERTRRRKGESMDNIYYDYYNTAKGFIQGRDSKTEVHHYRSLSFFRQTSRRALLKLDPFRTFCS